MRRCPPTNSSPRAPLAPPEGKALRTLLLGLASLALVGTSFLLAALPAAAEHLCDPEPIGRCGTVQRERAIGCFHVVDGRFVSATEVEVIALGPSVPGFVSPQGRVDGDLYVLKRPVQALVDDPWEAPFPKGTVFREDNFWPGLQSIPATCGLFLWFAECEPMRWMDAGSHTPLDPDFALV